MSQKQSKNLRKKANQIARRSARLAMKDIGYKLAGQRDILFVVAAVEFIVIAVFGLVILL